MVQPIKQITNLNKSKNMVAASISSWSPSHPTPSSPQDPGDVSSPFGKKNVSKKLASQGFYDCMGVYGLGSTPPPTQELPVIDRDDMKHF